MLINTNLDDSLAEKIDYLLKTTQLTLSDILKNSVNLYYELTRISPADRLKAFEESGFIGCGEGDAHLSVNYKNDLRELMEQKYGHG
jgi:hypothetical protein